MPANSLATFSTTGSPPPSGTTVAFLATFDINGQTVPISTGDVTNGLKYLTFSLANPVELGSLNDFLDYLHTKINVPLTSAQLKGYIDDIPSSPEFLGDFRNALEGIFATSLSITVLNIDVAAGTFTLGVTFPINLSLTSFLTIDSIGVVVSRGEQGSPANA